MCCAYIPQYHGRHGRIPNRPECGSMIPPTRYPVPSADGRLSPSLLRRACHPAPYPLNIEWRFPLSLNNKEMLRSFSFRTVQAETYEFSASRMIPADPPVFPISPSIGRSCPLLSLRTESPALFCEIRQAPLRRKTTGLRRESAL